MPFNDETKRMLSIILGIFMIGSGIFLGLVIFSASEGTEDSGSGGLIGLPFLCMGGISILFGIWIILSAHDVLKKGGYGTNTCPMCGWQMVWTQYSRWYCPRCGRYY